MHPCPVCHSEKIKTELCKVSFTYKSVFDLCECPDCRVICLYPLPTQEQFVTFYSTGGYEFNRWKQECKADNYLKMLNRKQPSGKFLDIGCATGYMINKIALDSHWDVYGVELSKNPAEFARKVLQLKNITHGDLFDANYADNFFDCINISDVLEHVPDPVKLLAECHRILKPDGYLILGVPNGYNDSRGLIDYYHRTHEPGCHSSGHVFFFQQQTFDYVFAKLDFKIVHAKTGGIKNGLRNLGILPRKRNWKDFYKPRDQQEVPVTNEIKLTTEKKYPDIYYRYRYAKHNWFSVPGVHDFGLDLTFILTPDNKAGP